MTSKYFLNQHLDMLTPIDYPLDKLEDLAPDEMYVILFIKRLFS